jgi:rare lipoprotein A
MTRLVSLACCTFSRPSFRILQRPSSKFLIGVLLAFSLAAWASHASAMAPKRLQPGETETGLASWYGSEQGRHTASGERFNPHELTAAHRHLPFGTIIRVTNNLNGKSVEVRINDRGPWRHGRIVDVTDAAADVLDMKKAGTVPVTIEVLKLGPPRRHRHA